MAGTSGGIDFPREPQRAMFAAEAVTDENGQAVFNFPPGLFSTAPVVTASVHQFLDPISPFIKILSASPVGCIVEVQETTGINVALVGLTLLSATTLAAGVTVDIIATEAG